MRVVPVLIAIGSLSCGDRGDDATRKTRAASQVVETKAREYGGDLVDRATQVKRAAVALRDRAIDRVGQAGDIASQAKAELDKVYRSSTDYDLDITTAAATSAHAEKLAAMPHVTVGGITVGYEQVAGVSTTGTSSKRHFRATWRRGDRDVIVGYQTSSRLDLDAFAALLPKLVPIVNRLL